MVNLTPKILLVEDDPMLGEGLNISLKLDSYEVVWKKTVTDGLEAFTSEKFDLAILDINLPDGYGTDLCKTIRDVDQEIGIIFLTAKTDEETVVRGLELGANDFVKKPFSHKELMARIKVTLRPKFGISKEIKTGDLSINKEQRMAVYKGTTVNLNRRQFDILCYFISHPNQIITRDQLLGHLNPDGEVFDRTVDSHVSQLRKTLKSHDINKFQIASIYGVGYRLEFLE
jgi:DNA-binding response OmpR family regulator